MLTPIFNFSSDSVCLYKGIARITKNNKKYGGVAEILLKFSPKAHLLIDTKFLAPQISSIMDDNEIDFSIGHKPLNVLVTSSQLQLQPVISKIKLVPSSNFINFVFNSNKKSKKILFHIFNFIDFIGAESFVDELNENSWYRLEYINLNWKKYTIRIQSLLETSENIKYLNEYGGSKITQVGSIEKQNGLISKEEQTNIQSALRYFLSFAKGSWINPVCSVGYAKTQEPIWYSFNSPDTEWKSLTSWFDERKASILNEFFPLYMNLWKSERWRDTFKETIYWFLNANDGERGVDAGLILAQTALERLSFEYIVYEKKLLSAEGFKGIRASDKFRLLFSSLNIPLEIPTSLTALCKKAKEYNWHDAPHALTEIRNSLVHPEHKKHGKFETDIFIESWTLSLWYLELSILAICKYDGTYSNRLVRNIHVGTVENVPWSN